MRPRDSVLAERIMTSLERYDQEIVALPGLIDNAHYLSLTAQIIESIRSVEYIRRLGERTISTNRQNPLSPLYDPLKAAVLFQQQGDNEEACWQAFLATTFGKHKNEKWSLCRDIYGAIDGNLRWTWNQISHDPESFVEWYCLNNLELIRRSRKYGNHRKYETLKLNRDKSITRVFSSYIEWITDNGNHEHLFQDVYDQSEGNQETAFDLLYNQMDRVVSYGRMGKFDYLCMLQKLGLANIRPGHMYIRGSSGPLDGAALLFGPQVPKTRYDELFSELSSRLGIGMQELEDALCNWQKSPGIFEPFRG